MALPLAAVVAGYYLTPGVAASSSAAGVAFGRLLATAHLNAGALGAVDALAALASPSLIVPAAASAFIAAAASWALDRAWEARKEGRETHLLTALYLLIPLCALASFYLADPMEITTVAPADAAAALGLGCLSSILVWICIFALGYRRDDSEGDRS